MSDPRMRALAEVRTAALFDMAIELEKPLNFGEGPLGRRVLFGSAGGTFEGAELHGEVLEGGGDWTLFRPDGTMTLDVRLSLRTHDGALIYMTYGGRWATPSDLRAEMADAANRHNVDPQRYYFRTQPLFESGDARYSWLNDIVAVGIGYLIKGGIAYKICRVL